MVADQPVTVGEDGLLLPPETVSALAVLLGMGLAGLLAVLGVLGYLLRRLL